MFNFFRKKTEEATPAATPQPVQDKTPAFLKPLYSYRAVGDPLDATRLDDASYIQMTGVLYEIKCPNPDCALSIRTQGVNLKSLCERLGDVSGCPSCKLQFGENNAKGYQFKEGKLPHEVLRNNGRWEGFVVRRVNQVPEEVFGDFAQKMYQKGKERLTRQEADAICDAYYASGK